MKSLHPIAEPPLYAFEYRISDVNLTGAGMRIDREDHVINPQGRIIPGFMLPARPVLECWVSAMSGAVTQ